MIQETKIAIKNFTEFKSEELFGATITQLLSREKLPTVGFDHVRIPKGSELKPHIHAASETFIYILEGTAIVTLDDDHSRVRAGDTIYIPAGVSHGFSTPDEAIALLSVQSPPNLCRAKYARYPLWQEITAFSRNQRNQYQITSNRRLKRLLLIATARTPEAITSTTFEQFATHKLLNTFRVNPLSASLE